jgi:hypothetical protein
MPWSYGRKRNEIPERYARVNAQLPYMRSAACKLTSSCSGPGNGGAGAAHMRHFIVHMRRAGYGSARPLNCGVRWQSNRPSRAPKKSMVRLASAIAAMAGRSVQR